MFYNANTGPYIFNLVNWAFQRMRTTNLMMRKGLNSISELLREREKEDILIYYCL